MPTEYVRVLGSNLGPIRGVKSVEFKQVDFKKGVRLKVTLACGHVYDDVELPVRHRTKDTYRCPQCQQTKILSE